MNNTTLQWSGIATATSSIVHGGETLGTITYLRRERVYQPDGTIEQVPIISGNAVRGMLRDTAADLWWEDADRPKLTSGLFHALWSGGTLTKTSGTPLTGSRLMEVKQLCPVVSIFGAAAGGRIINGNLQVGKLVPLCTETIHLLPERFHNSAYPSVWELTQIENESRHPNQPPNPADETTPITTMRYGYETFLPGTQFFTEFTLVWPTEKDVTFFENALHKFIQNAKVGGNLRTGHGKLVFNLTPTPAPNSAWKRKNTPLSSAELKLLSTLN